MVVFKIIRFFQIANGKFFSMQLIIFKNSTIYKEIDLIPGNYKIGRKDDCEIVLDGKSISRQHALLKVTKEFVEIEDLGSSNGVVVDGKKITKKKIGKESTCFNW